MKKPARTDRRIGGGYWSQWMNDKLNHNRMLAWLPYYQLRRVKGRPAARKP